MWEGRRVMMQPSPWQHPCLTQSEGDIGSGILLCTATPSNTPFPHVGLWFPK